MTTGDIRDGRGGPKGPEEGTADDLVPGLRVVRIPCLRQQAPFLLCFYYKITPFRLTTTSTMYHKLAQSRDILPPDSPGPWERARKPYAHPIPRTVLTR